MSQTTFSAEDIEKGLAAAEPIKPGEQEKPLAVVPAVLPAPTAPKKLDDGPVLGLKTDIQISDGRLRPTSFGQVAKIATMMVNGDTIPKSFSRGSFEKTLAAVMVAIFNGIKHNLDPMEAVQTQYVIGNVPRFWGKAVPGIIKAKLHARGERAVETLTYTGAGETRKCTMKVVHLDRDGEQIGEVERSFGMADAKAQGLMNKDTWKHSAERMMMHRARTYCYDDLFPDLMLGIEIAEVADDYAALDERRERVGLDERLAAAKQNESGAA